MKRMINAIASAALLFSSCSETLLPETKTAMELKTDFSIVSFSGDGATRAVKSGWEEGDVVFVFFQDVTADDKYLEMRYGNGTWTSTFHNGLSDADLTPDGSMTLTAVYLPFGNNSVPSFTYDGPIGLWIFDNSPSSYYLFADRIPYTVRTEENSAILSVEGGLIEMFIPDGFVQFFIDEENAVDKGLWLRATDITPSGVHGIDGSGLIYQKSGPEEAAIPGYAYGNGYLFSGIIDNSTAGNPADYTFRLTRGHTFKKAAAKGKTLQARGNSGRAANITGLSWQDDSMQAVPMFELNGQTVYFANMNMGAGSESDFGSYFAWGEVESQVPDKGKFPRSFAWNNYKWGYEDGWGSTIMLNKYCTQSDHWSGTGNPDNLTVLDPEDDAVTVFLGGDWRMPTDDLWTALAGNCKWSSLIERNGVKGYEITGKSPFESNTIFLPAAGYGSYNKVNDSGKAGCYWSSTLNSGYPESAKRISIDKNGKTSIISSDRCTGMPLRPVFCE